MYDRQKQPIPLEQLDLRQFIALPQQGERPLVKLRFHLDTPYLQQDFDLDLIIWNLTEQNLERTGKILRYVLQHFDKLFETGWTALYHQLCRDQYGETKNHTVTEFFRQQIDFESIYYTIQLEMNCQHQQDGQPRYCFVVATTDDDWMIADDDMRVYMNGHLACGFNDNNDDGQMQEPLEHCGMLYGLGKQPRQRLQKEYEVMDRDGFQYAEPFSE